MGVLLLGAELEAEVRRVREHAEKPENIYRLGGPLPGDNPAFVIRNGTYRIVFSLTQGPGTSVFRHLSVSTVRRGADPNIQIVCTLCHRFGFTGAPLAETADVATGLGSDWGVFRDGDAIAVQQRLP
jgi:hypothetical protein